VKALPQRGPTRPDQGKPEVEHSERSSRQEEQAPSSGQTILKEDRGCGEEPGDKADTCEHSVEFRMPGWVIIHAVTMTVAHAA
jgi:hypothetical protein